MNLNHTNYMSYENFFNENFIEYALQSILDAVIISTQSQKTTASRGKLNIKLLANDSTPLNRAFFVRNIRTPQSNADFVFNLIQNPIILSMVERNGQRLDVGCFPITTVFHPVTFYRPTVESLAVDSENQLLESTQMYQFIFALIRAHHKHALKVRLLADSEEQARARFVDGDSLLFVGRINLNTPKTNRTLSTSSMEVAHA